MLLARLLALPPSTMSVPRPAMFVAMVTAPRRPACATVSASCLAYWGLAFSRLCCTPTMSLPCLSFQTKPASMRLSISLCSTLVVPTRMGFPSQWQSTTNSTMAFHLASCVLNTAVGLSSRIRGLFVGTGTTSILYWNRNSYDSVLAVPVIPAILPKRLKKLWYVVHATVCCSPLTSHPSFASTAWCMPSIHRRLGTARPVNSSTMRISPSGLTM
mmetsp:Transcript_7628/g.26847  ORF Transcript_7628/g.26847 Transcript_7628/m.26847 type:complete len:215 (-) Transcript_7628:1235-1879(-)